MLTQTCKTGTLNQRNENEKIAAKYCFYDFDFIIRYVCRTIGIRLGFQR